MAYEFDDSAREEAEQHPLRADLIESVAARCQALLAKRGQDAVTEHTIKYKVERWRDVLGQLPDGARDGEISRGQLFEIGHRVANGETEPRALLTASYIWGQGIIGYGRSRYDRIVADAGSALDPKLQRALDAAQDDVIAGYAQLFGGYAVTGGEPRARPRDPDWSRIGGYGPAFFTKYLYFAVRGALILDNVLAHRLSELSGPPHLVDKKNRARAWTPYRYAVYLHWMRQTAAVIKPTGEKAVAPDFLELALFRPEPAGT